MKDKFDGIDNAIKLKPFSGDRGNEGKIYIASNDYEGSHCNIYFPNRNEFGDRLCIHPSEAKAFRDLLLKAYPLPKTGPEPSEYKIREFLGEWQVYQSVPTTTVMVIANAVREEGAKKIAQALNEAEGL
jgi:hypothetical protein